MANCSVVVRLVSRASGSHNRARAASTPLSLSEPGGDVEEDRLHLAAGAGDRDGVVLVALFGNQRLCLQVPARKVLLDIAVLGVDPLSLIADARKLDRGLDARSGRGGGGLREGGSRRRPHGSEPPPETDTMLHRDGAGSGPATSFQTRR